MNKKSYPNVLAVTIGGLFALVITLVIGLIYVVTQQNNPPTPVQHSEAITAQEIAQIVRSTIEQNEAQAREDALDEMLAPWSAAQEGSERIYGDPSARFSIVTFSDLECPFCKRFNDVPQQVVDASGGAVNYEFKHLPLDFHNPAALDGAVMTECVAKHKGNQHAFAFIDQYFKKTGTNGAGVANLNDLGKAFGLTQQQITACKTDKDVLARVESDLKFAKQAGVTGTPSSFVVDTVGGKSIQIGGAQGAEVFMNAVRSLLKDDENAGEEGGHDGADD